jgi:signal transduction histidine kinase
MAAAEAQFITTLACPSPSVLIFGIVALVSVGFGLYWRQHYRRYRQAQRRLDYVRIRSNIAANLHDELGSMLMRIHVQAESMLTRPYDEASLNQLLITTRTASAALRDVLWGLDASADTVEALQDRMRDHLDYLALCTSLTPSLIVEGLEHISPLPARLRQDLYLVFKEATTNVMRHAEGASTLTVRLYCQANSLQLEVLDNGSPSVPARRLGMGLRNMSMRAKAVGGQVEAGPRQDGPGYRVWFSGPLPCISGC